MSDIRECLKRQKDAVVEAQQDPILEAAMVGEPRLFIKPHGVTVRIEANLPEGEKVKDVVKRITAAEKLVQKSAGVAVKAIQSIVGKNNFRGFDKDAVVYVNRDVQDLVVDISSSDRIYGVEDEKQFMQDLDSKIGSKFRIMRMK